MIKRDTILVERITDGGKCWETCHGLEDMGNMWWCKLFNAPLKTAPVDALRCSACLSTPPAVVLTEEMENVLRGVAAMMKLDWNTLQSHDAVDVLRAAFPTIFGGGE